MEGATVLKVIKMDIRYKVLNRKALNCCYLNVINMDNF